MRFITYNILTNCHGRTLSKAENKITIYRLTDVQKYELQTIYINMFL